MGIQHIESVTYDVRSGEILEEAVRFFEDFGLFLVERTDEHAVLETLAGQTVQLDTAPGPLFPPSVESGPTLREVVWGVDDAEALERLVADAGKDRTVREGADGVHHTVDETGFGVGLTLARPRALDITPRPANVTGSVGRWNTPLEAVGQVRPLRMCHVALNIPKAGREAAVAFYVERLGFRPTDVVEPMGVFMQAPGDDDQHTFLLCHRPDKAGINHIAYEVPGVDDVIEGGNTMIERGGARPASWGGTPSARTSSASCMRRAAGGSSMRVTWIGRMSRTRPGSMPTRRRTRFGRCGRTGMPGSSCAVTTSSPCGD